MESISTANSEACIIKLGGVVAKLCSCYVGDVKDAKDDIMALQEAIEGLTSVLEKLHEHLHRPDSGIIALSPLTDNVFLC
ncbi:hypothetical protein N7532_009287 [Penicillium argentinense]|uniref:Fungal N-terminal domain-containing protein n=1 Tax=Penicillium argentinense TaxID=1131581 RepID=A0A9W9EZ31_9EURO|nr:uncharacterized protein N7532_009287 [Penicillium argentinense]KAJ5090603.1 hypothetical protein N7532_009287 [Penicillium argentinense]